MCYAIAKKMVKTLDVNIGKGFVYRGFQCTMVEGHCVKAVNGEAGGCKTLAAKMPLTVTKTTCRLSLTM